MPKLSAKRQITLPVEYCEELGVAPGDDLEIFIADGRISIVRKREGASRGVLSHIKGDPTISDQESLESALEQ